MGMILLYFLIYGGVIRLNSASETIAHNEADISKFL